MAFQTTIQITQALAVEGDFASANPRFSVLSVEGGFRAGAAGVLIARFAWADAGATNTLLLNTGTGAPTGFIHRALNGLNFTYFATAGSSTTFLIPAGFPVGELFAGGAFWVRNSGAGASVVGQKAFAKNADPNGGTIQFANAGSTIAGWTETKWFAATVGLAGELIKMSSQPLG